MSVLQILGWGGWRVSEPPLAVGCSVRSPWCRSGTTVLMVPLGNKPAALSLCRGTRRAALTWVAFMQLAPRKMEEKSSLWSMG